MRTYGAVDLQEVGATPPAPSADATRFYAKGDGFLYTLDSAGVETKVGTGTGGGGTATPLPVGAISMWGTTTAPVGWLLCQGGTFQSTAYPELATLLGDTYGTHSGTTYYLPDFKARSPVGVGGAAVPALPGGYIFQLGQKYGEHVHTLLQQELANHQHIVPGRSYATGFADWGFGRVNGAGTIADAPLIQDGVTGQPHENTPAVLGINFIIKAAPDVVVGGGGTAPALYDSQPLATGYTVTGSASYATVPGWTVTFTSLGTSDVFEATVVLDAEMALGWWLVGRPLIDDAVVSPSQGEIIWHVTTGTAGQSDRTMLVKTYKVSGLAAGTHTLKFSVSGQQAGSNPVIYNQHSVLSIKRIATYVGTGTADTGWVAFPGAPGWTNYGGTHQVCQYKKIGTQVFLRGLASKAAATTPLIVGTLPVGFRPPADVILSGDGYNPTTAVEKVIRIDVLPSGIVTTSADNLGVGGYVSLSEISFFID